MEYVFHILIMVGIYQILALSLDLLVGQTGILSVAQGAFFGLGAYAAALMGVRYGSSFIVGTLIGVTVATAVSFVVSLPALRMYDDYLVIATFGFQIVLVSVFQNWRDLTGGALGIAGIPRLVWFG